MVRGQVGHVTESLHHLSGCRPLIRVQHPAGENELVEIVRHSGRPGQPQPPGDPREDVPAPHAAVRGAAQAESLPDEDAECPDVGLDSIDFAQNTRQRLSPSCRAPVRCLQLRFGTTLPETEVD